MIARAKVVALWAVFAGLAVVGIAGVAVLVLFFGGLSFVFERYERWKR